MTDSEVVQIFWLGEERPAGWPEAVAWPLDRIVLPKDWVERRREELGLSARRKRAA